MEAAFDRIRILWIDDLPTGQTADLGNFSDLFEIIGKQNKPCWIRSIDDYEELRTEYEDHKKSNLSKDSLPPYFPVEIISADYDLSKFSGNDTVGPRSLEDVKDIERPSTTQTSSEEVHSEINHDDVNHDDFDGCLINMFYLSDFSKHPCGSVVTTYQLPQRRHRVAKKIERHMERSYGIDLSYSSLRRWNLILSAGVVALRNRIQQLYEDSEVVLSVNDLINIADGSTNGVLTLKSKFVARKLPVAGLFIDCEECESKTDTISTWAAELLSSKISKEHYQLAAEIADRIWETYDNDELVEAHQEFSSLHVSIYGTSSQDRDIYAVDADENLTLKYQEYAKRFGLRATGKSDESYECTSDLCLDIKSIKIPAKKEYQDIIVRWAVILLILKLLERILLCMRNSRETANQNSDNKIENEKFDTIFQPSLDINDILLLLYPVPKSPFPLPWHIDDSKARFARKEAWHKWLDRRGIKIQDLLNGTALTQGERCLIQGIIMNTTNTQLNEESWESWTVARRFVFGY